MDPTASAPVLYVFAISHYCEKARWALDYHDIEHELRPLAPGRHAQIAQQLGAPASSLPFLVADDGLVHGSGAILDWTESRREGSPRSLRPAPELEPECRALEQRLDDVAGVHVRRYYYSEAIVETPEIVRPIFAADLDPSEAETLEQIWPLVCRRMTESMDLGAEQREESRRIVEGELDALDERLGDGRRFLLGERFSRADLTAASLLAPLALPEEHPTYAGLQLPPRTRADVERWAGRPVLEWVRRIYREQR